MSVLVLQSSSRGKESAVCDCGISWSYSLLNILQLTPFKHSYINPRIVIKVWNLRSHRKTLGWL